ADDDVIRAHRRLDALRNFLQKLVADLMTVRVVDVLETIEIEEQHRERRSRLAGFLQGERQVHREKMPVRQASELIVMSQAIQSLLLVEQLRFDLALNCARVVGLFEKLFVLRLDFLQPHGEHMRLTAHEQQGSGTCYQRDRQTDDQQDQSCGSGFEMPQECHLPESGGGRGTQFEGLVPAGGSKM